MRSILGGALCAVCIGGLSTSPVAAQEWSSSRPDGHAPIGIFGDHTHGEGEMMLSYRFMRMSMDGNRIGTDAVSPEQVLANYGVTPLDMTMDMHMVGIMFAPSDAVTLVGMVPWLSQEMDHRTRTGTDFTASPSGVGDVSVSALVRIYNRSRTALHLNLGVKAPTGSIDERAVTPASAPGETILPYPMQLGSGTWDLEGGATWLGQTDGASWGIQAKGIARLGENDRDYRLGHRGMATGWGALRLNDWVSVSGRLEGSAWGDIDGSDPDLNPQVTPTADPLLQSGRRMDAGAGVNFEVANGSLAGQRIAVELMFPVWQDLDGPQLETDWALVVGWQYAFQVLGARE